MNLLSQLRKNTPRPNDISNPGHDAFLGQFLDQLDNSPPMNAESRHITVLARSPNSPVAIALLTQGKALKSHGVTLKAMFAELGEGKAIADFCSQLEEIIDGASARDHIRWARNKCLWDAHEQITLGTEMCWSGDCMRREPGKRDSLDLFETDAPQAVRLGTLAFDAIWAISEALPQSATRSAIRSRPSGAYAAGHEDRLSAFSFLRKGERRGSLAH